MKKMVKCSQCGANCVMTKAQCECEYCGNIVYYKKEKKKMSSVTIILLVVGILFFILFVIPFSVGFISESKNHIGISPMLSYDIKNIENIDKFIEPEEKEIINILKNMDEVIEVQAVTFGNDPNDGLNKADGYTSSIYFSVSYIDQRNILGKDLVEKGTRSGGNIEIYRNESDAKKRDDYLGTTYRSLTGGHMVIGSIVIRTSNLMSESKQQELCNCIIEAIDSNDINE